MTLDSRVRESRYQKVMRKTFALASLVVFLCVLLVDILCTRRVSFDGSVCRDGAESVVPAAVVFVISEDNSPNFFRVRDMFSSGPWPVRRVFCSPKSKLVLPFISSSPNPPMTALMGSHFAAIKEALKEGLEFALIVEDDARLVPGFWEQLRAVLAIISDKQYGVLWLQYFVSFHDRTRTLARSLKDKEGRTRVSIFNSTEHFLVRGPDGIFTGTGGYWITRHAMSQIVSTGIQWFARKTSESLTTYAAVKSGGFCAQPPLIWQCDRKKSYIQTKEKHISDVNELIKPQFQAANSLLRMENRSEFPEWVISSCL